MRFKGSGEGERRDSSMFFWAPEKRQHQLLLNLFTSFKQLIVFNKAKNFLKSRKMSFVFIWERKGKVSISLNVSQRAFY